MMSLLVILNPYPDLPKYRKWIQVLVYLRLTIQVWINGITGRFNHIIFKNFRKCSNSQNFPSLLSIYYGNNVEQFPLSVEVDSVAELVNIDDDDEEDKQDKIGFNDDGVDANGNSVEQFPLKVEVDSVAELFNIDEEGTNAKEKVSEPQADQ